MPNTLIIKNIGPINYVEIETKKINVFMGKQSSGKSTIAKLLSHCQWVEKDISQNQSFEKYELNEKLFLDDLVTFHNLDGYFKENSELLYKGDAIKIHFVKGKVSFSWESTRFDYKKSKILYIPSERSLIILKGIETKDFSSNYLRSFLFAWLDVRQNYTEDKKFALLNLGIEYYYNENSNNSRIHTKDYDINLNQASSGINSLTPILLMVSYLINNFKSFDSQSYELNKSHGRALKLIIDKFVLDEYFDEPIDEHNRSSKIKEVNDHIAIGKAKATNLFQIYKEKRDNLFKTHFTNFIIEEPEQNLFPSTQKELVYNLIKNINLNPDHSLSITTHSPYILYALNNCILASLTYELAPIELRDSLNCYKSQIKPSDIGIYELIDGRINSIQMENGMIGDNFFDSKMKDIMDEFYSMLNYLKQ